MDSNEVSRRKFFKGAGLAGLFAAGYVGGRVVVEVQEQKKPVEDISHLAPESNQHFVLQGNPKPVQPTSYSGNGFQFVPANNEYQNKVELSVGKDNMLWIKVGDEWKRVLTS